MPVTYLLSSFPFPSLSVSFTRFTFGSKGSPFPLFPNNEAPDPLKKSGGFTSGQPDLPRLLWERHPPTAPHYKLLENHSVPSYVGWSRKRNKKFPRSGKNLGTPSLPISLLWFLMSVKTISYSLFFSETDDLIETHSSGIKRCSISLTDVLGGLLSRGPDARSSTWDLSLKVIASQFPLFIQIVI